MARLTRAKGLKNTLGPISPGILGTRANKNPKKTPNYENKPGAQGIKAPPEKNWPQRKGRRPKKGQGTRPLGEKNAGEKRISGGAKNPGGGGQGGHHNMGGAKHLEKKSGQKRTLWRKHRQHTGGAQNIKEREPLSLDKEAL